ncbi:MAG: hypothetical protein P8I80_07990 [Bacteroidales bacterium]|jgi:hypothetical protein|nr:hypothetical protein [Bacteroidales bacterium]
MANKDTQEAHIAYFIHILDVFLLDWYIAKNETIRKMKSNALHHPGDASQQVVEQDLAININGVAMQCIIHNVPAIIPTLSVSSLVIIIGNIS